MDIQDSRVLELESWLRQAKDENKKLTDEIRDLESKLDRIEELESLLEQSEGENKDLTGEIATLERKLDELDAELENRLEEQDGWVEWRREVLDLLELADYQKIEVFPAFQKRLDRIDLLKNIAMRG